MTSALWITPDKVDGNNSNPAILLSSDNGGYDWSLGLKSGFPLVRTGNIEATTPSKSLRVSDCTLLPSSINLNQSLVYVNGVPYQLNSLGFDSSSKRLSLGSDGDGTNSFDGQVDDLRIWNRPLGATEISLLYGNGLGDLGPQGTIILESPTYGEQVDAVLTFNQSVTGFDPNTDLTLIGLNFSNSSTEDNRTFSLTFTPDSFDPANLSITLNNNAVSDASGSTNSAITQTIDYRPHRVAQSDLLVWWELNSSTADSSGNGNHGTATSADWNASGKFAHSRPFNGTDGRSVTHNGLNAEYPEVTLSAWVYPRSEDFHIFSIDTDGVSWLLERRRPLFSFTGISPTYLPGGPENEVHARAYLGLNQWSHLAVTYNLTLKTVSHYINGELDLQSGFPPPLPYPCPLLLGWDTRIIYPARLEKLMILESTTGHYLPGDHSTLWWWKWRFLQPYHQAESFREVRTSHIDICKIFKRWTSCGFKRFFYRHRYQYYQRHCLGI